VRAVGRELVILPVAAGGRAHSTSGLQLLAPRIYGAYYTPEGTRPRVGFVFMHPTSVFLDHYALEPLAAAGFAALGLNSRFVNNESALIAEQVILDLAAGVRFLRERGIERVILAGNSGGGALMAVYQSQAERPDITATPAGDPPDLTEADLPPADAVVTMAAHTGRAQVLTEYLDPSVLDERDPLATDPALDMFDPRNGPPDRPDFVDRYRAAQAARNRRITAWVRAKLAELERHGVRDLAFVVHRTTADPRFLDLSLDPSDRQAGTAWGDPQTVNRAALAIGRYTSLRSWLSQWGLDTSIVDGPKHVARVSVPVLVINYTADQVCFPAHARAYYDAVRHDRKQFAELKGANHYPTGQPEALMRLIELIAGWLRDERLN
jgi:pimeloyl-ACP methyl ester carboxylesterase